MNKLSKSARGFSLVELVTVIVILGIVGTVAMGKFENLSETAHTESARRAINEFERITHMTFYNYKTESDADPTTVEIRPGVTIPVNAQGWPGSPYTSADCLNLWQVQMTSSEPYNPLFTVPVPTTAPGWEYWGNGGVCLYFYKPDTTPLRYVLYVPATGQFMKFGV